MVLQQADRELESIGDSVMSDEVSEAIENLREMFKDSPEILKTLNEIEELLKEER